MCRVFSSTIILYCINVLSVNTQNFTLAPISKFANQNWSSYNYIDQSRSTFFQRNNECSRYLIKHPENRVIKSAVIIWNITQDRLFTLNESMRSGDVTDYISKPIESVLYVNVGCKSAITNGTVKNYIEYPKSGRTIDDNNEKIFIVKHGTKIFEVTIQQKKNFSSLLLEIPLESQSIETNGILELSLMRNSVTNDLHVTAINPSAGKWRLAPIKIEMRNLINSIYHNHNLIIMKNMRMSIITPERVSLPGQIHSQNTDKSEINLSNEENYIKVNSSLPKIQNKFARIVSNNINEMIIHGDNNVLAGLTQRSNSLKIRMKTLVVDLASETTLIVPPNTVRPIIFTIRNYLPSVILYTFRGSTSQFRIVSITPPLGWVRPGEIFKVAIHIQIPNVNGGIVNTVTLHVEHESNFEDVMKAAYIYVQSSNTMIADYTKPTIDYSFNNNCAGKLSHERCDDNEWSSEITVTDNESGVKNVISQPDGIQPKMNFIAGMKGSVNLQYRSTCCYTTVQITAVDVTGNSHTREIDVTAWDNLMVGEIAAIIIGALFLLLIMILIILLCIYCVKRRKNADITFTQRYGSRTNPRAERTNF